MSVYFARVRGYMKVGYSKNPFNRASTITAGSLTKPDDIKYGDAIELLGWIPGDRWTERATHLHFAPLYVIGEWFLDDESFDDYITADPFGVDLQELPGLVVFMMERRPDLTRAEVLGAWEAHRAIQLDDPNSDVSHARDILGGNSDEWLAQIKTDARDRRAADRAFWREQRAAA